MPESHKKLKRITIHAVAFQILSIVFLSLMSVLSYEFDLPILIFIGFFIIVIYSAFILKILIFDDNPCPNCRAPFFKKEGSLSNLGFSIYTKKCTNCKFYLR